MRRLSIIFTLIVASLTTLAAREPLYVVNGTRVTTIEDIPHEDIERIDVLPANEETWSDTHPAERVSLRIKVDIEGRATIAEVLESTSRQLLKSVSRAIAKSPRWSPATRHGKAVESIHLVNLKLPTNKELPVEPAVIIR